MTLIAVMLLAGLCGCSKKQPASEEISILLSQMKPLRVRENETVRTITLDQAIAWHEDREHSHEDAEQDGTQSRHSHSVCLGVLAGFQAIHYAHQNLYAGQVPSAADFSLEVTGPMDGVWDVISLYSGKDLSFDGEMKPMDINSFTFTAHSESQDRTIRFRLKDEIIPTEFFILKNQGATCGDPEIGKIKQQILLSLLNRKSGECFAAINE